MNLITSIHNCKKGKKKKKKEGSGPSSDKIFFFPFLSRFFNITYNYYYYKQNYFFCVHFSCKIYILFNLYHIIIIISLCYPIITIIISANYFIFAYFSCKTHTIRLYLSCYKFVLLNGIISNMRLLHICDCVSLFFFFLFLVIYNSYVEHNVPRMT